MSVTLTQNVKTQSETGTYTYKCVVTENSSNISTNSSNVTITLSIKGPWSPTFSNWTTNCGIIVDGVTKKTGSPQTSVNTSYVQLLTWTGDIQHNQDGTKNIDISVYLYHNSAASYLPKPYKTGSPLYMGKITLTNIPRQSGVSSITKEVFVGKPVTVNIDRKSSDFTHAVRFYINDTYTSERFENVGTSKTFTIPESWLNAMPSSTSCTAYCNVATYDKNGNLVAGHVMVNFKIVVPDNIVPTVGSITLKPTAINGNNILVKNKNALAINASGCAPGTGSKIKSYTFYSSKPNFTTTITSSSANSSTSLSSVAEYGTLTFSVKVTDTRGRTSVAKSSTIVCHDYFTPYIYNFKAYRADSNGNQNINGTYIKCTYSNNYASVNNTNKVNIVVSYNGKTTNETLINLNGNNTTTYNVYITITDSYGGVGRSSTVTVLGQARILNVTQDGTGFAIGKMAEGNNLFECRWPAQFDDNLRVKGDIVGGLKFSTNNNFFKGTISNVDTSETNTLYFMTGLKPHGNDEIGLALNQTAFYTVGESNDGKMQLGAANRKWSQLYAATSTISTSDRNKKKDIEDMSDVQEELFNQLKPVTYKMIDGTSDRTHYGFISQDVEGALSKIGIDGKDFAGFCKDVRTDEDGKNVLDENGNEIYDYSLRYSEFIALNTFMIQKLQERILELEQTVKELKGEV